MLLLFNVLNKIQKLEKLYYTERKKYHKLYLLVQNLQSMTGKSSEALNHVQVQSAWCRQ